MTRTGTRSKPETRIVPWDRPESTDFEAALAGLGCERPMPEALKAALRHVIVKKFAAGAEVMAAGAASTEAYIVHTGRLEVRAAASSGAPFIRWPGPGEIVGEMGLLSGAPRSATVTAAEETELFLLTGGAFHKLMESSPGFRERMEGIAAWRSEELRRGH